LNKKLYRGFNWSAGSYGLRRGLKVWGKQHLWEGPAIGRNHRTMGKMTTLSGIYYC